MVSRRCSRVIGLVVVLIAHAFPVTRQAEGGQCQLGVAHAQGPGPSPTHAPGDNSGTVSRRKRTWPGVWVRVLVPDPVAGHATRAALDRAWALLAQPDCANLLTDFTDRDELPLADRLTAIGLDAQTYLTKVVFLDDTRDPSCVTGVLARTAPGSRVVRLCSDELKRTWQQDSAHVVAALIHEMLHTLGLGENPPTSKAITARVLARCRP